jgi:putative tryptophan/tyrosine transport system substrate-binding protein
MRCRPAGLALVFVIAVAILFAPLAVGAQQAGKVSRIGYLSFFELGPNDDVFRQGLRDLGWVEGKNLVIEYRLAGQDLQRLRPLAEELVRLRVALIVTVTGRAALAAREVTSSVPIVMAASGDAVSQGLVASLARPGGNVTGTTSVSPETIGKRLELLKETVPRLSRVAYLGCLESAVGRQESKEVPAAAAALGLQVQAVDVPGAGGLKSALNKVVGQRAQALLVGDCPSSIEARRLAELALRHRLPTMVTYSHLAHAGGLMAYGPNQPEQFRRAASYVDKILKGAKPGDLPVEQPTKFELVINLKTAKALGLTIPQSLLGRADELIQ